MRSFHRRRGLVLAGIAVCLAAAGCSPGPVKVTGTVLRDGKPIPVSRTGVVQVTLIPDVAPGEAYTSFVGRCDETGKFEVLDVKPGKYKVVVEQFDPNPMTDKLAGAFSAEKTPIRVDVDGKKPIEIDLAKP
jgi:hypothetical protein